MITSQTNKERAIDLVANEIAQHLSEDEAYTKAQLAIRAILREFHIVRRMDI